MPHSGLHSWKHSRSSAWTSLWSNLQILMIVMQGYPRPQGQSHAWPPASWYASLSGEHQKDQSQLGRWHHSMALCVVPCNIHNPVSREREPLWHSYHYTAECSLWPDTSNMLRALLCLGCGAHQQAAEGGVPRHGESKREKLIVRRVRPEMMEETPWSRHLP